MEWMPLFDILPFCTIQLLWLPVFFPAHQLLSEEVGANSFLLDLIPFQKREDKKLQFCPPNVYELPSKLLLVSFPLDTRGSV